MRLEDETPGTRRLYAEYRQEVWNRTDRLFLWLLGAQWLAAVAVAIWASPQSWDGTVAGLPPLVWKAFFLGAAITALPGYVALRHPGWALTRQEVAIGQGLLVSLLVHVSGGRTEIRYAMFMGLACLAMYRDMGVILLASGITALDHIVGCYLWPHSVYGMGVVSSWAWVTDLALIAVEDVLLAMVMTKSHNDMLDCGPAASHHRGRPGGAGARGRRTAAHRAPAVAAVRDHARVGGRQQPGRGGSPDPAHHGREPGLAGRRAVGGGRGGRAPRVRGHLERARVPERGVSERAAGAAHRPGTGAARAGVASATCRCGFPTWATSRPCRWPGSWRSRRCTGPLPSRCEMGPR